MGVAVVEQEDAALVGGGADDAAGGLDDFLQAGVEVGVVVALILTEHLLHAGFDFFIDQIDLRQAEGGDESTDQAFAGQVDPAKDVQEARNALAVYEQLDAWEPANQQHLLDAHALLMKGLIDDAGYYRQGGVGVMKGEQMVHMAPPANRVSKLLRDLLGWLGSTDQSPLIASCVFHYEFEFIHPFADGNGRMGRLWQTLILSRWHPLFAHVPVESLVHAHQTEYYMAINDSTRQADSAPFIVFMLSMLRDAILSATPQVAPQVTPQVAELLRHMVGEMNRAALQDVIGLADRKSFRERYLRPALDAGLIAMTRPDKPNSRLQCYYLTALGEQIRIDRL